MNLSQDEINALLSGDSPPADTDAGSDSGGNLSPEAIEAMLAAAAGEAPAAPEADSGGNMSPEAIEAMLAAASGEAPSAPEADSGGGNMSPEAIEAMLAAASGEAPSAPEADSGGNMSPEAIEAMLAAASGEAPSAPEADSGGNMSPEAIEAMLAAANGGMPETEAFVDTGNDALDDLFARFDSEEPAAGLPQEGPQQADNMPQPKEGMLTPDQIDVLGEVGNISMGAVATTMYTLLDRRVSITTPRVSVYSSRDVLALYRIPFVVVTVEFVEGITGNNLLVLKVPDAALITDLLMGGDGIVEEPIELTEMHLSAMSEIMNQMMGASSTSLSKMLQMPINISTPKSASVGADSDLTEMLDNSDLVVKISFDMEIEGLLKSELLQLLPYKLGCELAAKFLEAGLGPEPEKAPAPPPPQQQAAPPQQQAAPPPPQQQAPPPQQPYPQEMPAPYPPYPPQEPYPQAPYPPYPQAPYPPYPPYPQAPYPPQQPYQQPAQRSLVDVHPMQFQSFDTTPQGMGDHKGIDLVYDIPLQVTVELGKTKKQISEILEFGTGTIVVLDKIAGDPVEIVVNGKLIARGEVVVIEENYGVRITDIING